MQSPIWKRRRNHNVETLIAWSMRSDGRRFRLGVRPVMEIVDHLDLPIQGCTDV